MAYAALGRKQDALRTARRGVEVLPLSADALFGAWPLIELAMIEGRLGETDSAIEHISVAQSIDALLVAPATADVIGKFAHGLANDFLSTLYLATKAPVIVAPARDAECAAHWSSSCSRCRASAPR